MTTQLEQAWDLAKQRFAAVGVDVEEALRQLDRLPVSMHCWQGDDVAGFENPGGSLDGGIQATGNYPGKARNATELRADLELALSLIPGPKRLNLHAIYLESDEPVARNEIKPEHFTNWVAWAKANRLGLDFNPSCFSHPLSADGFTLAHANDEIRQFWIDHVKASRRVSAYFGEQLGTPSVMNIWIPDGMKDITVDRLAPRQRLLAALDEAISEKLDPAHHIDAVESKLFGIGAELHRGLKRVLHGLCHQPPDRAVPGCWPLPPNGSHLRQDLRRHALRAAPSAARQPPGALGQRPRGAAG